MERFFISTRHGLLEIRMPDNAQCCCSLILPGDKKLVPRKRMEYGQLLLPFGEIVQAEQYLHDADAISNRIRRQLLQAPIHRKILLEFCIRGGLAAVELFEDAPAIALLLAHRVSYDPGVRRREQLAGLAGRKRTEILAYCNFPAAPWIARVLKKIPTMHATTYLLKELGEILLRNDRNQISVLRHLPTLSRLVIEVLNNPEKSSLVTWDFYLSASSYPQTNGRIGAEHLLEEIIRIGGNERVRDLVTVPKISSVLELRRIHDEMADLYMELQDSAYFDLVFQKPPLAEQRLEINGYKVGIFALRNGRELYLEGKKMRHCIASYADQIHARKDLYAYHVCSPDLEEATIMITRNSITWRLLEIRGIANRDVSSAMMFFVEQWLHEHNKALEKAYHGEGHTINPEI